MFKDIIKKIKIKIKEHQYDDYIWWHRDAVRDAFTEMVMCPDLNWILLDPEIYDNMLTRIEQHDMSKYSEEEYDAYRKHFYPINEQEKNESEKEFDAAWEHHWKTNDHHWQNRVNDTEFNTETECAILENVCDWLAMGYKFKDRPYQYYERNKEEITSKLPAKQIEFLEKIIYDGIDKNYCKKVR